MDNPYLSLPREGLLRRKAELENSIAENGGSIRPDYGAMNMDALMRRKAELESSISQLKPRIAQMDEVMSQFSAPAPAQEQGRPEEPVGGLSSAVMADKDFVGADSEMGENGELGFMGRLKARHEADTGVSWDTFTDNGFLKGYLDLISAFAPFASDLSQATEGRRRLSLLNAAKTGDIDTTLLDFGATTRALNSAAREWDETEGAKYDLYRRNAEGGALDEELGAIAKMERGEDGRLRPVLDENGHYVLDEKYAGDRDAARKEAIKRHALGMLKLDAVTKELANRKIAKDESAWYTRGLAGAAENAGLQSSYWAGNVFSNVSGLTRLAERAGRGFTGKLSKNAALLALPLVTNAARRYYQLRADDVGFDEDGNLTIAQNGLGTGTALGKAALGSVAENVTEVALGKMFDAAVAKPLAKIAAKLPGAKQVMGFAGKAAAKSPEWLKKTAMAITEGYGRMQNYTHLDGFPGEMAEEFVQGAFDDVLGLDLKDPRQKKQMGQFTREFFDWDKNFKDLAVGMLFTMAGQAALGLGAGRIRNQMNSMSREVRGVLKANGWTDAEIEDASYKQRLATAMSLSPELSYNMRYGAAELARLGGMSENDIKRFTENGDLPYAVFALSDAMNTGVADQEGKEGGRAVTLRPTAVTDADGNMFVGKNGKVLARLEKVESRGLDEIKGFMTHFSQAQQDALNLVNERMALDGWRGLTQADLDAYGDTSGFNGKEKDEIFWFSGENGDKVATDNATGTKIVDVGGNGEMYTVSHPGLNTDYIAYGWESARNWADRAAKLAQAKEARRGWKQGFVQDMVKRIVPDGGKAPSVRYYNTVTDIMSDDTLPMALREQAAREGANGNGQAVTLPDGSIAVFLDNMQTPGQAAVGIVHEIAGHGALDTFFTGKEGGAEKRAGLNRRGRAASEETLGEDVVKQVEKDYADSALDEELNVRAHEGIGGDAMSGLGRTAVLPVGQGRFQRLASRLRQFLAKRTGMQFDLTPDEWDAVVVEGLERMARGDSFPRPQTAPRRTDLPAAKTRTDIGEMVRGSADKTMAGMREAQRKATMLLGYTPGLSDKDKEKLDKLLAAKKKWQGTEEFENAVAKYRVLVRQYRTAQAANKNTPKGKEKPYSKEQMKEMRDAISAQWKVLQAFGESEAMQKRVAEKQTTQADRDSGLGELFEAAEMVTAEEETPEEPAETPKEPPREPPKAETPAKTPTEAPRSAPAENATTTPPKGAERPEGGKSADLGVVQAQVEEGEGRSEAQKRADEQKKTDSAAAPALKNVLDAARAAAKFIEGGVEVPAGILNNLKFALRELKKHPMAHWDLPVGAGQRATLDDIGDVNEAAQVLAEAVVGNTPSDATIARFTELIESEIGEQALRDHDLDVIPKEVREAKAKKELTAEEQAQAEADEEARGNLVSAVQSAVESGDLSALKTALEPFKKDPNLSWNFGQGSGWNLDRLGANKNKAKWNRIPESIVNMGGQFILSNAVVTDFVRNVAGEGASEENVKAAVAAIRDTLGGAPAQRHAQAVVNEDIRAERREKTEMNSQVRRMERMNKVADFLYRHYQMDRATALRLLSQLDEMRDFIDWMNPRNTDSGMYNYARPTDAVHGTEWDNLGFMWNEITGRDPLYELWLTDADESDYDTPPGGNDDAPWMDFSDELHPEDQIVQAIVDRIREQHDQFRDIVAKWKSLPEGLREQIKRTGLSGKMGERIRRRFDKLQRDLYTQAESALSDFQESRDLAQAEKDYAKLAESYDAMDDDAKQVVAALRDLIDERRGADQYVADSIALREAFLAAHPNSDPFAADITREDIEEAREYIGDEAADRLQREKDLAELDWSMADTAAEDDGSPLPFRKAGRGAADGLRGDVDWLVGGGDRALGVFNRWRLGGGGLGEDGLTDADRRIRAATMEAVRRAAERNGGRVKWDDAQVDADVEAAVDSVAGELPMFSGGGAKTVFTGTDTTDGELFAIFNDPKRRDGDRQAAATELFRRNYPRILGRMFRRTAGSADAPYLTIVGLEKALGYTGGYWKYTPGKGDEGGEVSWVPVKWGQTGRKFDKERDFFNYALKSAIQELKQKLRRESNKRRMGQSVPMVPVSALIAENEGSFDENDENTAEGFLDAVDAKMRNVDGTGAPTDKERQYRFERGALMRHTTREFAKWLDTLSERDRRIAEMVGDEKSIREIADETGMTESAVKSRVAALRMDLRKTVNNPFLGVLRGATSGGNRNYEQFVMGLPRQERIVWLTHRTTGGDRGEIRNALRRDWEAMRSALESGNEKALAARGMDMESARREVEKWERRRARAQEKSKTQGDLFGDGADGREPWDISDQHITTLVNRTKAKLAAAGMNEDGTPRGSGSMSGLAQGLLTPKAAKEASGVPMMARREQAKEAPKAEAAPAPSIPGLKRRERAVQGELFDMKWRKGASPEQQRIIGVLEKLMTDEGTPDMRWRKAQDVLKKEGLFGGAMSEHIARMRKQEFPDGSTEKVGAESLVIRTGDTVKKYRDARSFTKADLDKIMWHNDLFGDRTPYEFKDVVYDDSWSGDYRPARIVLEQPYVEIREGGGAEARRLLVEDLKRKFGVDNVKVKGDPSSEGMEIDAGPYHIADLKDLNIGIDERTGDYAVWDANIERRAREDAGKWRKGEYLQNALYEMEDRDEYHGVDDMLSEFDRDKADGRARKYWQTIPAEQYQSALRKFMREGELFDYPESVLRDWLNRIIGNTMDLDVATMLAGHAQIWPTEEVAEHYGEDLDENTAFERLEKSGFFDWARLPDGSDAISDYGLRPLYEILGELPANPTPAQMMTAINRALDVVHARGDLSSLFVSGGSKALSRISNDDTADLRWRKSAPFSAEADSAAMTEDERRTIEEMRRDPKFSYSGYMAERAHDRTGELARGEAKLANATSFLEKAKLFFTDKDVNQFVRDRIREGLQDQHIHLRRMEERMFGGLDKIDKGADLYYFRDANIGRAGNLEMEFEREMITPLHDEIKKLGDNGMDRLNLVLNALHAPERNRMIAERTDGKTLDGSGMTTAFAKAVLDKAAADGFLKAEFDPKSKTYRVTGGRAAKAVGLVRRIIDTTRQLQVQSGRKSAADAKNEARLSPNYVPLRTDMEDTLKEFAHAFGRQSLADSPVAYSELLLKAAMSGFYENVERRRLAQLVQRFPGYGMVFNTAAGDILTETQVERFKEFLDYMKEHGGAMTERMAEELKPLGIASQKELEARLAASGEGLPVRKSLVNGKVRESVDTAALDRKYPDIVSYMRDGQVWFVRLGGEKLSKAEAARIGEEVKKSGMLRLNLALKTIRKATRWFSQLRTSYSPEFLVSNFFADNRQAVQNIMSTFGAKAAAQFERNIGSVFGGNSARSSAARYLRGELDPAKHPIDRYTQEWAKNGGRIGGMSFSNFKDVDDGIRKLVRDYEQAARGDKKLAALGKKIKKGVEDLNAAVEMGTRIAAYATCRENGYSVPDAVSYSRDITVNFDRRGNWTPVLNSLYAFSNASIQDVHRTLVAIGGPADWAKKGGKRGLAVLAGMALLGFLRAALGYGQDDPEEAVAGLPQYEYTSEYEKQDMFGLRVGKANYAIPIRGLARLPYYAGQKVYEVLADKTSAADAAKDLGSFVAQNAVDPIGNSDNLLQTVAPSIIRPAVEYAQNTNFAGNQIFRQPRSSKDVKSEMGYRNTQGVFKWAARALNELTGGSASRSGMIDMQPEKIQHIYSAITGSLGADLLRAGNFAYDLANGEDVLAVENARNIPFVRRVRRDLAANSRTFRDAKDRYEADLQDWNANEGNSAVRAEIARSAPYLADERWAQELKDLSNAAQKLMTEENKAEGDERKAAQELRMRVQALFIRRLKEPPRQTPFAREQKQAQKDAALFLKKRKESQKRTERRGRIPMLP